MVNKMFKLLTIRFPNRLAFVTLYLDASAAFCFYHLAVVRQGDACCSLPHSKYFILETWQNQPSEIRTRCVLAEISGSFSIYSLDYEYHPISLWLDNLQPPTLSQDRFSSYTGHYFFHNLARCVLKKQTVSCHRGYYVCNMFSLLCCIKVYLIP